jgi:prepilin-type N-terminal cleavage/methylation domain-containing protein
MKISSGNRKQAGFSMLEMLVVVAILTIVMAVVFGQIMLVQKRSRTEDMKLDMTQESREFVDEVVRDVHSIGYPTQRMFGTGTISVSPITNSHQVAVGLVKIAYDELWFEGDVDGDGNVDVIDYKLQVGANGKCPCKLARSQNGKIDGNPFSGQNTANYNMELNNVINSGGAGGGASGTAKYSLNGTSGGASDDTVYASYKTANIFTFYDETGTEVTPTDYSTSGGQTNLSKVRAIRININVLAPQADLQTGAQPVMSYSVAVRTPNQ